MDRLLARRRVLLGTHITLGILSGTTCAIALIIFVSSLTHGGPSYTRAGGTVIAVVFIFAALPLILSYLNSADREAETATRFAAFLLGLIGISIVTDVAVAWILATH